MTPLAVPTAVAAVATMTADVPPLTVYFDGACPVCAFEMAHLRRRAPADRLCLVDISAGADAAAAHGFSAEALDAEIHAVTGDGTVVRGMAALRLAYSAAALGWLLRPTGSRLLRPLFDAAYRGFARHRHAISSALAPLLRVLSRKGSP